MKMRKGGVIIDVPENGAAFYIRAGYTKVETKEPVEIVAPAPVVEVPKKKEVHK